MKHILKTIIAFAAFAACACAFGQSAEVAIFCKDKSVVKKQVQLQKNEDGSLRLRYAKGEIPPNASEIRVIADFMRAKTGDEGFWLFPRGEYGRFTQKDGVYRMFWHIVSPVYAMQSPKGTYMGYLKTLRFEFGMEVKAEKGEYYICPVYRIDRMGFAPYDDIVIDFYKLEGKDANYSGIARLYRKMQFATGQFKTIKERMQTRPWLKEMALSVPVRIQFHGSKNPHMVKDVMQTKENEPKVVPVMTFDQTVEFIKAIRDAGVDKVSVCSAGWQSGGYDGRFPQLFPIPEELGGEAALKRMTKAIWDMGFPIACHTNSTDCYQVADIWSDDLVCKNPDGSMQKGGVWAGGRAHNLCTKRIWQLCLPQQLKKVKELGFDGSHYIDVFTATAPHFCADPNHPATRKEMGEVQLEIAKYCVGLFGGFSSECGYDHLAAQLDYCNYVSATMRSLKNNPNPMVERVVPFWEIVYHGTILSTPDRLVQNHTRGNPKNKNLSSADLRFMEGDGITDPYNSLKIVEFGGRPIFYTSHMRDVPYIKKAFDEFKPVRHLQFEQMRSHEKFADGVFVTEYENGAKVVCNYNKNPFIYKGKTVAPMGYILIEPETSFWDFLF